MSFELKDGDQYVTNYAGATNGATTAQAERHLRNQVAETLRDAINDFLIEEYEGFELIHGLVTDDDTDFPSWVLAADDLVFEAFQGDVAKLIGVDLIGSFANDMRLWEPDSRLEMASKLAKAIAEDIEITLPKEDAPAAEAPVRAEHDAAMVMALVRGSNPGTDDLELYDMLADCGDSDNILAGSAAHRTLPGSPDMLVETVRQAQAKHGAGWIDVMLALTNELTPQEREAEAAAYEQDGPFEEDDGSDMLAPSGVASAPAEKPKRGGGKPRAEPHPQNDAITTAVARLSEISGHTDVKLAEKLGMSRSHFLKAKNGETTKNWTPDQLATIGALIEENREAANQLSNDFGALDD